MMIDEYQLFLGLITSVIVYKLVGFIDGVYNKLWARENERTRANETYLQNVAKLMVESNQKLVHHVQDYVNNAFKTIRKINADTHSVSGEYRTMYGLSLDSTYEESRGQIENVFEKEMEMVSEKLSQQLDKLSSDVARYRTKNPEVAVPSETNNFVPAPFKVSEKITSTARNKKEQQEQEFSEYELATHAIIENVVSKVEKKLAVSLANITNKDSLIKTATQSIRNKLDKSAVEDVSQFVRDAQSIDPEVDLSSITKFMNPDQVAESLRE